MDLNKITVVTKCSRCGKTYKLRVYPEDLQAYREGAYIQDAFPYIDPSLRELLVTGICPSCWDAMFSRYDE